MTDDKLTNNAQAALWRKRLLLICHLGSVICHPNELQASSVQAFVARADSSCFRFFSINPETKIQIS